VHNSEFAFCVSILVLWNCGLGPLFYMFLGWCTRTFISRLARFLPLALVIFLFTLVLTPILGVSLPLVMMLASSPDMFAKVALGAPVLGLVYYFYGKAESPHSDYEIHPVDPQHWESVPDESPMMQSLPSDQHIQSPARLDASAPPTQQGGNHMA